MIFRLSREPQCPTEPTIKVYRTRLHLRPLTNRPHIVEAFVEVTLQTFKKKRTIRHRLYCGIPFTILFILVDHIFYFVVSIFFTFFALFPSCLYSVVILFAPSVTRKRRKALLYPCSVWSSSRARATFKEDIIPFQNDDIDTGGEHSKGNIKSKHEKKCEKVFWSSGRIHWIYKKLSGASTERWIQPYAT